MKLYFNKLKKKYPKAMIIVVKIARISGNRLKKWQKLGQSIYI